MESKKEKVLLEIGELFQRHGLTYRESMDTLLSAKEHLDAHMRNKKFEMSPGAAKDKEQFAGYTGTLDLGGGSISEFENGKLVSTAYTGKSVSKEPTLEQQIRQIVREEIAAHKERLDGEKLAETLGEYLAEQRKINGDPWSDDTLLTR